MSEVCQGVLTQFGFNTISGLAGFYGGDTDAHQHAIICTRDGKVHELFWHQLDDLIRVHVKVLTNPVNFTIQQMIDGMRQVFSCANIRVDIPSTETLNILDQDIDVGACAGATTQEQNQLFNNRNNVQENDIVVYFVRTTVPPLNGCASHPDGRPGCVVTRLASRWTLAHEIGHVLGLNHVDTAGNCLTDRLMTGCGTNTITNPPLDLINTEVETMQNSNLIHR